MPSFPYAFIPSFIRSLNPSLISFIYSFVHEFILSFFLSSFLHSFIHFMSFHFMSFHVISCHVISCHFMSCHFIHCIFLSLQASFHFSQFTKKSISFLLPMVSSHFGNFRPGACPALDKTDISEQVCWQGLSSRVCGMLVWSFAASHKLRGLVCLIIINNLLTRQCSAHPSVCLGKLLCKCNVLVGGSQEMDSSR